MANDSAKKIIAGNAAAMQRLQICMGAVNVSYFILRHFLRPRAFFSWASLLYVLTLIPTFMCTAFLTVAGGPRRDRLGNPVSGVPQDLNGPGLIEIAWDVLYWTWGITVLVPLTGYWFYWAYLAIPGYFGYRAYKIVAPMIEAQRNAGKPRPRRTNNPPNVVEHPQEVVTPEELTKTQAKKKARQDKAEKSQKGGRR